MALELVQARVNHSIVELPGAFADTLEHEWFRIQARIDAQNIQHNSRSGTIITRPDIISITDDEEEFPLVVILESCEGA
jgi:hypothetical protein